MVQDSALLCSAHLVLIHTEFHVT